VSHNVQSVLTLIFCYLLGSILFGLIISESMYGMDIRKFGSGNVGFTNMKRTLGWKPAIAVLLLDTGKGVLAVWLCRRVFGGHDNTEHVLILLGGVLSIIGHNWSVFYDFAGGKGVATSLGVLIALDPRVAALALLVGFPLLIYPGYMSIASVVGTATVPFWFWLLKDPAPYIYFGLLVLAFVAVRHRSNWERLRQGTESRFSFRGRSEGDSPPAAESARTEEVKRMKDEG